MLHLPWCRVEVLTDALAALRADGWVIGALTPAPDAISIHDWSPPLDRTVLLLGTEGPGLSAEAMAAADVRVRIPIEPDVDSLNVGHTTSVALALLRQAAIRR